MLMHRMVQNALCAANEDLNGGQLAFRQRHFVLHCTRESSQCPWSQRRRSSLRLWLQTRHRTNVFFVVWVPRRAPGGCCSR